ncbi:MAG: hypothetical protein CFE23_06865 [Flavobacterium sp. BFFFF1]|uniref:hypothetical protein n=1 Tax=unclassified Flavobacterium TaxID=196869 RepID=UPI000BD05DD4|nr:MULTISPECIES: hypothetical protein [unclassified Flavobacterium]OYU80946.1 MAG: hypothetical protein CFE23_06865 [Flavobacterium sp. BFFFF1]
MKRLALLLLAIFALNSCSPSDDGPEFHYEVLPVESYTLPASFDMNQNYEIKVKYKKPSNCHYYQGIYYEKDGQTRTIGVQTSVLEADNCAPLDEEPVEVSFQFLCTPGNDHYTFKFYKGEDAEGNNVFEEVTVPVTY